MGSALTGLSIAASIALAAQSTPPSKVQPPPDGGTLTVTGCLAKGEPAGSFILIRVHVDSVNTPTPGKGVAVEALQSRRSLRVLNMRSFAHVAAECK